MGIATAKISTPTRIKTPTVQVGKIRIGSKHPIVIQSMTNTDTTDAQATAKQCMELADAGAEIMRITVNTNLAAPKVPEIRKILDEKGYADLPLVGDFHFNGHTLLTDFPQTAKALSKYRINPGNSGSDKNFDTFIKIAIENDKPVRIGVNWGSLDRELLTTMINKNARLIKPLSDRDVIIKTMVESALKSAARAEKLGLPQNKIVLSAKMSVLQDMVQAYELLAEGIHDHPYALHLGLTEAGSGEQGLIASSAALAILLQKGIGDTIRYSLTPAKKSPRTAEVEACKTLLQSMGYRNFRPQVISCPGCGRTDNHFYQELAEQINENLSTIQKKYPQAATLKVAVMGCVVNGPGESSHADIAISLPGKLEKPVAPVYIKGKFFKTLSGKNISEQFMQILEKFVNEL